MRAPNVSANVALVLAAALLACGGDRDQPEATPEPAQEEKKRSNVVTIKTAVPYGKKVACADMLDLERFAEHTQLDIGEIRDRSESNSEATAVCAFMRGGEPPKDNEQLRNWEKNNLKLGVLPGDEYCMLTAYCSAATDPSDFETRCEERGMSGNEDIGVFACVRQTQRGPDYAYTYRLIDPDTKCIFEVMGGPSVTDESLVQRCAKASMDLINSENLTNFK